MQKIQLRSMVFIFFRLLIREFLIIRQDFIFNLQCEAVIQIPADGTPGDDYTDQFTVCFTADGELVTGNRLVMPVMLPDVLVGVTKRNGS